jgi:choline-sulfatase
VRVARRDQAVQRLAYDEVHETRLVDHLLHVGGKLASKYSGCDWSAHLEEIGLLEMHRADYRARTTKPRYFAVPSSLPRDEQCDSYTGRMTMEWLASRPRRPFFLWVSFPGPHNPWDAPGAYGAMYNPADMPPPLAWSEQFEGKPPSQRKRSEQSGLLHLDAGEVQAMAAQYYGLISNIDDWCGRIIAALRETGALDNTVVIYTSDHGEMLGDHRFITKGCFYESAARIPLLVADYRTPAAGATCPAPAEIVDVYRTVLEVAGAPAPAGTFGDDLRALAAGEHSADAAFSELGAACMVRAGRWKYTHDPAAGGPQELYDMEEDPQELRNLVDDPEHRAVAEEARARLLDWRITTDARDLEEWSDIEAQLAD